MQASRPWFCACAATTCSLPRNPRYVSCTQGELLAHYSRLQSGNQAPLQQYPLCFTKKLLNNIHEWHYGTHFCKWCLKVTDWHRKVRATRSRIPARMRRTRVSFHLCLSPAIFCSFYVMRIPLPTSFMAAPPMSFFILPALGRSSLTLSTRLLKLSDQLLTPSSSTQQAHSVLWDELWLTPFLSPLHPPYLPTYLSAALSYSPPPPPSLSAEIKTTISNYIRHLSEPEEEWWEKNNTEG